MQHRLTRSDCIVALGGGVVGDLAGFWPRRTCARHRLCADAHLPARADRQLGRRQGGRGPGVRQEPRGQLLPAQGVLIDTQLLCTLPDRVCRRHGRSDQDGVHQGRGAVRAADCVWGPRGRHGAHAADRGAVLRHQGGRGGARRARYRRADGAQFPGTRWATPSRRCSTTAATRTARRWRSAWLRCRRCARRGLAAPGSPQRIVALLERYGLPHTLQGIDIDAMKAATADKKRIGGRVNVVIVPEIGRTKCTRPGRISLRRSDKVANVVIHPGPLKGTVQVPPCKSMAHRLLICAALADGRSDSQPVALRRRARHHRRVARAGRRDRLRCRARRGGRHPPRAGARCGAGNRLQRVRAPRCASSFPIALQCGGTRFTGRGQLGKRPLTPYYDCSTKGACGTRPPDRLDLTVCGTLPAARTRCRAMSARSSSRGCCLRCPWRRHVSTSATTPLQSAGVCGADDRGHGAVWRIGAAHENGYRIAGGQRYAAGAQRGGRRLRSRPSSCRADMLGNEIGGAHYGSGRAIA